MRYDRLEIEAVISFQDIPFPGADPRTLPAFACCYKRWILLYSDDTVNLSSIGDIMDVDRCPRQESLSILFPQRVLPSPLPCPGSVPVVSMQTVTRRRARLRMNNVTGGFLYQ